MRETTLVDVLAHSGPLWKGPRMGHNGRSYYSKRFILMSVSGSEIVQNSGSGAGGKRAQGFLPTAWSVLDSRDSFKEIATFKPKGGGPVDLWQRRAQDLCDELNAEDRAARRDAA